MKLFKLNKVAVCISMFICTLALILGVDKLASAGTTGVSVPDIASKIIIDCSSNEPKLWIKQGANKRIYVSFPSVSGTEVTGEKNVYSLDAAYGLNGTKFDLSTLNPTKDNYIKVWGDVDKQPIMIKIPASDTLGKAKFRFLGNLPHEDVVAEVPKKGDSKTYNGIVQFAVEGGNWNSESFPGRLDVTPYKSLGATIRARIRGSFCDSAGYCLINLDLSKFSKYKGELKEYSVKKSTTKILTYEPVGWLPSKEIKFKVPKAASAPKLKVDYKKGTVTLPKNAEYRVNTTELGEWTDGSGKVFKAGEEGFDITNGGDIDVRIKATDKKSSSMFFTFLYDKQVVLSVEEDGTTKEAAKAIVKTDAKDAVTDLTLTYARTVVTGKKPSTSGAIILSNANKDFAYEYLLVKDDNGTVPADDVKGAKAIKNGKDVMVKIKNDGKYTIYVRRAAATKNVVAWATKWVKAIDLSKTDLVPTAIGTKEVNKPTA